MCGNKQQTQNIERNIMHIFHIGLNKESHKTIYKKKKKKKKKKRRRKQRD